MKKILMAIPPIDKNAKNFTVSIARFPNYGIAQLASLIKEKQNWQLLFVDGIAENLSFKDFLKKVIDFKPDVVAFHLYTLWTKEAGQISSLIKNQFPTIKIIVGGPHALVAPIKTLAKYSAFDFLCNGDGFDCINIFLEQLSKNQKEYHKIPNLVYRKNDTIVKSEIQNQTSTTQWIFPDFSIFKFHKYRGYISKLRYTRELPIFASIGCRFSCSFCSSARTPLTVRAAKDVVNEMDKLQRLFKTQVFYFCDENFGFRKSDLISLLTEMKQRGGCKKYKWRCNTRIDNLNAETILLMKQAGCIMINFGVESGSPRILKIIHKNIKLERVIRTVELIKNAKISSELNFMIGFLEETEEDIKLTKDFIQLSNPDFLNLSFFTPLPGTEAAISYQKQVSSAFETSEPIYDWKLNTELKNLNFSQKRLSRIYLMIMLKFYIRPSRILNIFKLIPITKTLYLLRTILKSALLSFKLK